MALVCLLALRLDFFGATHEPGLDNRGTPGNPMTDAELERKCLDSAVPLLGADRAHDLVAKAWRIDENPDVAEVVTATALR